MIRRLFTFRGLAFGISLAVLPIIASAADNWIEVRSPHFTVKTNANEKEARKIADQFEQIRQMFHLAFSTFRVDPAQPVVIIAAKNESTMKLFLPEEWEVKGHIHHAGMYQPGQDKDYVVLRLDLEGENAFHALYHEYTHALLRLNFSNLPIWLNEGLAEFFGNSTLGDKQIKTGTIDSGHLYLLNQSKLIPIETLLQVDHSSPYYNEKDRASVFYAESWAVVHYLMMDNDARQRQVLKNFLNAWDKSGDQLDAARAAFGDLKQFGKKIESYARQGSFQIGVLKLGQEAIAKNYAVRPVSPGEALALQGDFFAHHNRADQALPVLEQAIKAEPNLAFAHEALGFCHYRKHETEEADKEILQSITLGASGFAPWYFHGVFLMQGESFNEEAVQVARNSLEKAVQLNPQFAPAFEALAQAYSHSADMQKQAVSTGIKAVQLDPAEFSYAINLAYLLLNNRRFAEARTMAQRVLTASVSQGEKVAARNLLDQIGQAEEWAANRPVATSPGQADDEPNSRIAPGAVSSADTPPSQDVPAHLRRRIYGLDGSIRAVDCSRKPEATINVDLPSGPLSFHTSDLSKVSLSWEDGVPQPALDNCSLWKGRKVKVWFSATPGKQYAGEISRIHFF